MSSPGRGTHAAPYEATTHGEPKAGVPVAEAAVDDEKLKLFHSKHCVGQVLQEVKELADMVVYHHEDVFTGPEKSASHQGVIVGYLTKGSRLQRQSLCLAYC